MMTIELVTELPMGLLSFWLFHTTKKAFNMLNKLRVKKMKRAMVQAAKEGKPPPPPGKNAPPPNQWSPMYPLEAMKTRMYITAHELIGPRWNAVGTLGFFVVRARHSGKLQVSLKDLKQSAKHFTIVVYAGSETDGNAWSFGFEGLRPF